MKITSLLSHFGLVRERRFVAVMSICNVQLTLCKEILNKGDLLRIVDGMEAMLFACFVNDADFRMSCIGAQQAAYAPLRVFIHAHNRAKIGGTCPIKLQAIFFCFCQRMFMWKYNACAPRFQTNTGQEAGTCIGLLIAPEDLLV